MKGYVFITDNPFAAVTKADGSFEIKDVPAGEQHLIVWQSTKGYVTPGSGKGWRDRQGRRDRRRRRGQDHQVTPGSPGPPPGPGRPRLMPFRAIMMGRHPVSMKPDSLGRPKNQASDDPGKALRASPTPRGSQDA